MGPRSLFHRKENLWYPVNGRLDDYQSKSGRFGDEKNLLTLPDIEPDSSDIKPIV